MRNSVFDGEAFSHAVGKESLEMAKFDDERLQTELGIRQRMYEKSVKEGCSSEKEFDLLVRFTACKNELEARKKQTKVQKYRFRETLETGAKVCVSIVGLDRAERNKITTAGYMFAARNGKKFRIKTESTVMYYWFEEDK